MTATMKCPKCGVTTKGETEMLGGFSGITPGSPLPQSYPVAYSFECGKCDHTWTAAPEEVELA